LRIEYRSEKSEGWITQICEFMQAFFVELCVLETWWRLPLGMQEKLECKGSEGSADFEFRIWNVINNVKEEYHFLRASLCSPCLRGYYFVV